MPHLFHRASLTMMILAITTTAPADVIVAVYHDETDFHFERIGIPDLDQERYGLVNFGACHCVPTCTMNLLIYAGGHGFPAIEPGPGAWGTQAKFLEATDAISDLGQEMAICYGDGTPGKCDPTVCDSDGDCVTSCGSRNGEWATIGLLDWLGPEANKLVVAWTAASENWSPRLHQVAQAAVHPGAPLMRVNYGRYNVVAYTPGGDPIYRRGGGHAMSFAGCRAQGFTRELWTRDPAQDEGDLFGQSPFADRVLDVTEMTILVTQQYDGGPIVSWYTRAVSALEFTPGDDQLLILDIVAWMLPTGGYSWTGTEIMYVPHGDQGFGIATPDPTVIPLSGGTIVDVVPDLHGIGVYALVLPPAGPSQIRHVATATATESVVDELSGVAILCSGRQSDLFALANDAGGTSTTRRLVPAPGGDIDELLVQPATLTLPFPVHGATYDDDQDHVVIVSSEQFVLVRATRDLLDAEFRDIPTTVPLIGRVSVALEPNTERTWVSSAGSDHLYGLTPSPTGGFDVEDLSRADIVDPTGLAFDDDGRLFVRTATDLLVLRRTPTGDWERDDGAEAPYDGLALGGRVLPLRSRSNYDAEVHHPDGWYDIDAADVPEVGEVVRDCPGDVDGDLRVGVSDLLALLAAWGEKNPGHPADLDGDGGVGVGDLLIVLAQWGAC